MKSQPKNPEFRNNPENFHPYTQCAPIGACQLHIAESSKFPKS